MSIDTTQQSYQQWIGRDAYDRNGDKIGKIDNVYLDTETGRPEWLAVNTGLFGMNTSLVPIEGSQSRDGGDLTLDVDKDMVKDAPHVGEGGELDQEEEQRLYRHYQIDATGGADAYTAEDRRAHGYEVGRRADAGYEVDEASLTRREEEVRVGTHSEAAGSVRLRKYVTTEMETVTVPVEKERVVVERTPAGGTSSTGEIGDEVVEMELREDVIDVDKRVVDKETVRAGKERVTETEKVQTELRKEQVEVEGDVDPR